jgi:hypothetical protein
MKKSDCTEELHHAPAAHTASMLIVTPTSAETTYSPTLEYDGGGVAPYVMAALTSPRRSVSQAETRKCLHRISSVGQLREQSSLRMYTPGLRMW